MVTRELLEVWFRLEPGIMMWMGMGMGTGMGMGMGAELGATSIWEVDLWVFKIRLEPNK